MENINQETPSYREVLGKYQIVNNIPEKQALILQNTNKDLPIQLRVDPVTDYTALWITVFASVIASAITAVVTIFLVTRSNNNLIVSQRELQEKLINNQNKQQINELNSKYRQEWINDTRKLISNFAFSASQLIPNLFSYLNSCIIVNKFKTSDSAVDSMTSSVDTMNANIENFKALSNLIDLTLSKDNTIDREIYDLTKDILANYSNLHGILCAKAHNNEFEEILQMTNMYDYDEANKITQEIENIKEKTKVLLKTEWERVKKFDSNL